MKTKCELFPEDIPFLFQQINWCHGQKHILRYLLCSYQSRSAQRDENVKQGKAFHEINFQFFIQTKNHLNVKKYGHKESLVAQNCKLPAQKKLTKEKK